MLDAGSIHWEAKRLEGESGETRGTLNPRSGASIEAPRPGLHGAWNVAVISVNTLVCPGPPISGLVDVRITSMYVPHFFHCDEGVFSRPIVLRWVRKDRNTRPHMNC